jgi:hypothetical protein
MRKGETQMNYLKKWILSGFTCVIAGLLSFQVVLAKDIVSNEMSSEEILKIRKMTDDPTPIFKKINYYKDWVSKEGWEQLTASKDPEEHRRAWEKARGFKATDATGTIAPEIKPGKYTLADKERLPFKELMPPHIYARFNEPGGQGKNFGGNFTEFEVIPTRQLYLHYGVAMDTIKNEGKARLGEKGYADKRSYESGIPFPKPSGPQAGWQVIHNMDPTSASKTYDDYAAVMFDMGIDQSFTKDREGLSVYYMMKLARRSIQEPKGKWYDARAERLEENSCSWVEMLYPRDVYGTNGVGYEYDDPDKPDKILYYTPMLRRIRLYTSSDQQDQMVGADYAGDDDGFLAQDLRPDLYPYEVKILEEREFLIPAYTIDGDAWVDSKNKFSWRNLKMERRPCYLVEMKQLDSNYIYSKRLYWVDKENFIPLIGEYYDQKGRLWRSCQSLWAFNRETGCNIWYQTWAFDHIDVHSTFVTSYEYPGENMDRKEISPKRLMTAVK